LRHLNLSSCVSSSRALLDGAMVRGVAGVVNPVKMGLSGSSNGGQLFDT